MAGSDFICMKMEADNIKFLFPGLNRAKSYCNLTILKNDDKCTVVFTERKDNPGTSVTNGMETLIFMVKRFVLFDVPWDKIDWVEHYEGQDGYDLVSFTLQTFEEKQRDHMAGLSWKHYESLEDILNRR